MARTSKKKSDDLDDFDMGMFDDMDYDDEFLELEASSKNSRKSQNKKKGDSLSRLNKTAIWDDDWIDPADDLMYGFEDDEPQWNSY